MERRHRLPLVLAGSLLVSLAGCLSGSGDAPDAGDAQGPSSGSSGAVPNRMSATDCKGVSTVFYGPTMVFSEPMPPGWEERDTIPATEVFLRLYECQKVSWGPFERGPVTMLAEVHGSLDASEGCLEDRPSDAGPHTWLTTFWFSDRELAEWVKTNYGAPVHYGEFKITQDATPAGVSHTWSWRAPEQEWSFITMRDIPISDDHATTYIETWFWFNGLGISYMDFSKISMSDDTSAPVVDGHMAPPMMFATASGQGNYAAIADWFPSADFDAPIRRFGDLECKVPA